MVRFCLTTFPIHYIEAHEKGGDNELVSRGMVGDDLAKR